MLNVHYETPCIKILMNIVLNIIQATGKSSSVSDQQIMWFLTVSKSIIHIANGHYNVLITLLKYIQLN